jgi:hypothetical protein
LLGKDPNKVEVILEVKKSFSDACILKLSEKLDPGHNRPLDLEFPEKQFFNGLEIQNQKDLDNIQLAIVSNNTNWRWVFEMKNGKKTENKSGIQMTAYPIQNNVGKLHIHYANGSGSCFFGISGLKFFDQAGNLLLQVGIVSYPHKEIVLSADERIVGVVGREHPEKPNYYEDVQFMIAKLN